MTQEEKELLLKYLCMALPYNVKCHVPTYNCAMTLTGKRLNYFCFHKDELGIDYSHEIETVLDPLNDQNNDYVVKPYLRPMSSMTGDELKELKKMQQNQSICSYHTISMDLEFINWYLAHHFDINHLIDRGLAIEVTEDNNPYK